MLKAELSDEAAWACYESARRIIDYYGVNAQDRGRTYERDDLVFACTSTGDTEITVKGHTVLRVSLPGTGGQKVVWVPGEWVEEVDRIDQSIELGDTTGE